MAAAMAGAVDLAAVKARSEAAARAQAAPPPSATAPDGAPGAAVQRMVEASRTDANMLPAMLDAVRAEATLGEICGVLRAEWGGYREPVRF